MSAPGPCLRLLRALTILLTLSLIPAAHAAAWRPASLTGRTLGGAGVASSHPDLVLDANPAGLAFGGARHKRLPGLGLTASRLSVDALRFWALDNGAEWSSYINGPVPGQEYEPPSPEFLAEMDDYAGRLLAATVDVSIYEAVRPHFGFTVYAFADKQARQNLDAGGAPAPDFDFFHESEIGAKFGFARDAGSVAGGDAAIGLGVDFAVSQESAVTGIDDAEAYQSRLRDGFRSVLLDDPDPGLRYSTRLGIQWRQRRPLLGVAHVRLGAVLVDPVGSREGIPFAARGQAGLALEPAHEFLPLLMVDTGSLRRPDGAIEDGFVLGAVERIGPLSLVAAAAPWSSNYGASLDLRVLRFEYMNVNPEGDWAEGDRSDRNHTVRIVLGSSTKPNDDSGEGRR